MKISPSIDRWFQVEQILDIGYNFFSFEYNRRPVTLKWITCICTSTGSECLEGPVRHRKSRLSLGTHTAIYSRLLSNALPIPVSLTAPIILRHTTSPWIKHAFYLEVVIEEFKIMIHRLKRIMIINLDTQNNTGFTEWTQNTQGPTLNFLRQGLTLSIQDVSISHFIDFLE